MDSKALRFFRLTATVAFYLSLAVPALAQVAGLEGGVADNLMSYVRQIVSLVFYISLTGCLASLVWAGYTLSKGDNQGMDKVKMALLGTAITAGAAGIFKFFVFAGQESGVSGKGDLF